MIFQRGLSMIYPIQTNVFAMIVLAIIYLGMRQNKSIALKNERYFYSLIYSVAAILIFDTATEVLNGVPGTFSYILHAASLFFLYATSGIIILFWILYTIDYIGLKSKDFIKLIYALPSTLFVVMAFHSLFFDSFFSIDSDNVYSRGPLFSFYTLIFVGYVLSVLLFILLHLKNMKRADWLPLITLPIFPAIGGLIQFLYYGALLLWPMTALSLLVVYVFIQLRLIRVDNLTQLYNKHEFNRRIQVLEKSAHPQKIGCMVCDINHFKTINDTYGHFTGDIVLKELSHVFEETFNRYNHFVARIGGDEFGFLFPVDHAHEFDLHMARLQENLEHFNSKHILDFDLSISIGAGLYDQSVFPSLESFFRHLDDEMYRNKKQVKKQELPTR